MSTAFSYLAAGVRLVPPGSLPNDGLVIAGSETGMVQTDEQRVAFATKIVSRIVDLEKGAFGLYDEV